MDLLSGQTPTANDVDVDPSPSDDDTDDCSPYALLERFGRYVILESLGVGGTGRVDLALTLEEGRERLVVLKRPRVERDENGILVRMFHKEARLAARFAHPNLVSVFGIETCSGEIAIAMEHLDGHSLAELGEEQRANGARASVPVAIAILREALLGLDWAHDLKGDAGQPLELVHRDFTPHNVFVTRDGHTRVLDFGIAKLGGSETQTATGLIKGKLGYMAPEQIFAEPLDRRVDVFAAGVVLWELLSGKRLARSRSLGEVVQCALDPLPALGDEAPAIDADLSAIVARAVAVKREERYPTAAAFREALESYAATQGAFAAPSDVAAEMAKWLGADARARDERIRAAYPFALRMLAERNAPRRSSVPTVRMPSPPSDAPVMADSRRGEERPPRGVWRTVGSVLVSAVVAILVAAALSHTAPTSFGAAQPREREYVVKHVIEACWGSHLAR